MIALLKAKGKERKFRRKLPLAVPAVFSYKKQGSECTQDNFCMLARYCERICDELKYVNVVRQENRVLRRFSFANMSISSSNDGDLFR